MCFVIMMSKWRTERFHKIQAILLLFIIIIIYAFYRIKGSKNLYLSSVAVFIGAINVGLALGFSSPLIKSMQDDTSSSAIRISDDDETWIGVWFLYIEKIVYIRDAIIGVFVNLVIAIYLDCHEFSLNKLGAKNYNC